MKRDDLLMNILQQSSIDTVYQPIVSLEDGTILGYEALSRLSNHINEFNIEELFKFAAQQNQLWELEVLCRRKAFENSVDKPKKAMLFINVDPNIITDPKMKAGFTQQKLQEYGMNATEIVYEVTERSTIQSLEEFDATMKHYREQGYKIAVDDFGAGYSGLNRVCAFSPEYLKLDRNLIQEIDQDSLKKSAVSATIRFCKESGIKVIAEGIETEEEFNTLIELGADYGQGYYLSKPKRGFVQLEQEMQLNIKTMYEKEQVRQNKLAYGKIGEISKPQMVVKYDKTSFELYEMMKNDSEISEVFVVDSQEKISGTITRSQLFQKYCSNYGESFDPTLTVEQIMRTDYLAVDSDMSIDEVSTLAMNRDITKIYDGIAVMNQEEYVGIVSVKDLLLATLQVQVN